LASAPDLFAALLDTLCRDTLGTPLHHGPTEGGAAEDRKFHGWYDNTLASYRRYFGEPPKDLWPSAEERFDARHEFVRIDRRDVVTIDRALLKRGALAALGCGSLLAVANAIAQADASAGSDSDGALLVVLAVIGVVTALIATAVRSGRASKRQHARRQRRGDAAAAAGAGTAYVPSDGSHCPPGSDCPPAATAAEAQATVVPAPVAAARAVAAAVAVVVEAAAAKCLSRTGETYETLSSLRLERDLRM
jgi:hypothetical protein